MQLYKCALSGKSVDVISFTIWYFVKVIATVMNVPPVQQLVPIFRVVTMSVATCHACHRCIYFLCDRCSRCISTRARRRCVRQNRLSGGERHLCRWVCAQTRTSPHPEQVMRRPFKRDHQEGHLSHQIPFPITHTNVNTDNDVCSSVDYTQREARQEARERDRSLTIIPPMPRRNRLHT
ncbi:hypothetical protein OG21DRAFT_396872 [Imleria badia]|nr:hypothetical protein OG21DRAFT_396872 [Imleria badia]